MLLLMVGALAMAEHLGRLHPYERLVVAAVALGPFLVLGVVVYVVRRRDLSAAQREASAGGETSGDGTPSHRQEPGT